MSSITDARSYGYELARNTKPATEHNGIHAEAILIALLALFIISVAGLVFAMPVLTIIATLAGVATIIGAAIADAHYESAIEDSVN